ncbi:unnamed protein product [Parnassius apollo]|uniref:(apollo) hypothetical protein n=1 Tax=Parnassius apollo TaxID=110799 RepID=A0A8S3X5K7_PARAO|nr:unnamed protein product [Parnassius apollo]
MSTTTRKVQAQRKFAQGAYIPQKNTNNVSNTTAERKTDLISPKETNNNFFHNSSSAKSLLDIVCFQNVHVHKQPIVLLERLHESQSVFAPGATNRVTRVQNHRNMLSNEAVSQKSKPTAKKHCMLLRSRTNQRPQKRVNIKEINLAPRRIITRNIRKFLSSLNRSDSSDFNTDDDKPLAYFTRTVKARKIKRNIKTTTECKIPRRNAIDEPVAMSVDKDVQTYKNASLAPKLPDSSLPRDEPVAMSVDKDVQTHKNASLVPKLPDSSLPRDSRHAMQPDEMLYIPVNSPSIPQVSVAVSVDKVEVSSEASFGSQALDAPLLWDEPVAMSVDKVDKVVQWSPVPSLGLLDSPLPWDETIAQSVDEPVPSIATSLGSQRDELPLPRNDPIARSDDEPSPVMSPVQSIVISLGSQQEESPLPRANEEVPTVQGGTRVIEFVEDTIDWASTDGEQNIEKTVPAGCSINELNAWIQETIKQKKHVNRFKIPHPPRPKQSSRLQTVAGRQIFTNNFDMPSTSTVRAFSCPSKRYTTSREVLQAPKEELDKRCMKCKYCDFVNRVFERSSERKTPSSSDNSLSTQNEGFSSDSNTSSVQWNTSYSHKRKRRCRQAFRKQSVNTGNMGGERMSSELPPSSVLPLPRPRSNNRPQPPQPIKSFYSKDSNNIFEFKLSWLSHKKKFILSADPIPSPSDIVMTELNSATDSNIKNSVLGHLNNIRKSVINNDDGAIPSTSRGPDPEPVVTMPVKENSNNVGTRNRGGCQAHLNSLRKSVINNDDGAIPSTSRGPDPEPVVTMPVEENSNNVGTRNRGGCQAHLNSLRKSVINNDDGAIPSTSRGPDPEPVVTMPVKENSNNVGTRNRGGCQAHMNSLRKSVINNDDGAIPSTSRGPDPEPVVTMPVKENSNNVGTRNRGGCQAEKLKAAFPRHNSKAELVDAPVFYPTEDQFLDPIAYFNEIMPTAAKFGICKIVAPGTFKPKCVFDEEIKFGVTNQYISRLYTRWGPASREMSAIKAHLASQSVVFTRPPLLNGIEVNLPKLYELVQRCGGLKKVIEKKRWSRVAEEMKLTKSPNIEKKIDQIYVKYILPYDTMSNKERLEIMNNVEVNWNKKNKRMLDRALNPLHRQKRLLGESESSEEDDDDDLNITQALIEAEDCIVTGRYMNLATFKKVANKVIATHFSTPHPATQDVESAYWKLVIMAKEHVCVNAASIDTGEEGYGFTKNQRDIIGRHPWNLKVLSCNPGNILRYLGSKLGVTVPTLHLGMVFSTSCWHRDPHGLPWIEFMHSGPAKIWYGIPDEQSANFRRAVELLCPTSCQNKSLWLSSDIVMIPPNLLLEHNVSLSRVEQKPGEFIVVFPKAYSCSISTGYTVSESVYFANNSWLKSVHQVFNEVRESCEPTMFSLEQLLLAAARDPRSPLSILPEIYASLRTIISEELDNRTAIIRYNVPSRNCKQSRKRPAGAWNVREQDECEICRATLYLSRVRGLPTKKSTVCLQHGRRLLESRRQSEREAPIEMDVFLSEIELEKILQAIQMRLVS